MLIKRNESPKGMSRAGSAVNLSQHIPTEKTFEGLEGPWYSGYGCYYMLKDNGEPDYNNGYLPSGIKMSGIEATRRIMSDGYAKVSTFDPKQVYEDMLFFVRERESIRLKKEAGEDRPWTEDEMFDKTKFCNVFRELDKTSAFIFNKVKHLEGEQLFYNLLISRLINRVDILDRVLPTTIQTSLAFLLEGDNPVLTNPGAYQLSPRMAEAFGYETTREVVVHETRIRSSLVYNKILEAPNLVSAIDIGNKAWGGYIPFTLFQVLLDFNHLTNYWKDDGIMRIGQGGKAVHDVLVQEFETNVDPAERTRAKVHDLTWLVDRLNSDLAEDIFMGRVARPLQSWDVEHLLCEVRKRYHREGRQFNRYSYKPNSMGIAEGTLI